MLVQLLLKELGVPGEGRRERGMGGEEERGGGREWEGGSKRERGRGRGEVREDMEGRERGGGILSVMDGYMCMYLKYTWLRLQLLSLHCPRHLFNTF